MCIRDRAEAIQAAVDKVNEMLKDAPSQEALYALKTQISAIETNLATISGTVDALSLIHISTTNIKEDLLATKRKILNNNRIIKAFTLSILICIDVYKRQAFSSLKRLGQQGYVIRNEGYELDDPFFRR